MERFILNLAFYSMPKSLISDSGEDYIIFTNEEIDKTLRTHSAFHFNRDDLNFFSQHGNAAYSYWCQSVSLTKEEVAWCNDSHDLAVGILFNKLRLNLQEDGVTAGRIKNIDQQFDCRCQIELFFPDDNRAIFKVQRIDLNWMADMHLDFEFRMLSDSLLEELKKHSLS
ncbi:hypothetical protein [Sporosarcina beigongshangi]|uniref:hypothetical protein n=1 Tax=Sporosarcina beigongshangi TaxID=2782538 RepID=UPI00193970BD|nr:hypothetical protein [Sporosarcina beigongshangi]